LTKDHKLIFLILLLTAAAILRFDGAGGTDASASYVACRLVFTGESTHLYAYDPVWYNLVSDPAWDHVVQTMGFPPNMLLSPFVQTPLWPYVLQPLCATTSFVLFNHIFAAVLALCFVGLIWLTGRYWAPRFFTPLWVLVMAALWLRADPLREAMLLTQTHAIFLLLAVLAVLCAQRGRPWLAGALLACAAVVKITPAALMVYWLVTGKRKAAFSCAVSLVVLTALTVVLLGHDVSLAYLHSMTRVSNILLISPGNESLAAWWLGRYHPESFRILPLPTAMKLLAYGLILLCALLGGYADRRREGLPTSRPQPKSHDSRNPPYGAVLVLLGASILTPIAWDHYMVLLVVPLILLLDDALRRRSYGPVLFFAAIYLLANSKLLLRQLQHLHLPALRLPHSGFYAAVLAMAALFLLGRWRERQIPSSRPSVWVR
jgi:hypothetical protein